MVLMAKSDDIVKNNQHTSIKNNEIVQSINQSTYLDGYSDKIPTQLDDKIQLSVDVTPIATKLTTIASFIAVNNTLGGNFFTTSTTVDTYLTAFEISIIKDVTNTSTFEWIELTPFGSSSVTEILPIASLSLTAQSQTANITLNQPLKIARGTQIALKCNGAVANIQMIGNVFGFTVDPTIYDTRVKEEKVK
jgi:hypothetical protein